MTARYARETSVPIEATRNEIERLLLRYGATGFFFGTEDRTSIIGFRMKERMFKFRLTVPPSADYKQAANGRLRTQGAWHNAWDQAKRSYWRALLLVVKAKLEAVEVGIVTFEDEFMPQTVMPDGQTVAEWMGPQLAESYANGIMPPSLLMLAAPEVAR
jgi:hypothetical protein